MFFFKKKKKLEEEEQLLTAQETELYAQDIIPLRTIEGSFIRRSDGVSLIGVFIEGVNDSLYTYDNKLAESRLNQQALAAIQSPCSILKIPKTIDANLQLVHIDNEITNLKHELREAGIEQTEAHPKAIRLKLLMEHERPKAEIEALNGSRVIHPTYIFFEFAPKITDEIAMREVRIFIDRIRDFEREAHVCDFEELIEVLQLYFTPHHINPKAYQGRTPVTSKQAQKR